MDYRLVTYKCLHFTIIAQHDYNLDEPDDSSHEGLLSKGTSTQRHSELSCGSVECQNISQEEWIARVHQAISHCRQCLSAAVDRYYQAGHRYYSFGPSVRAASLRTLLCEPAHEEFGSKICSWVEDPFFKDWQDASDTLQDLDHESFDELDEAGQAEVVAILNSTRATLSGVQGKIASLVQGVDIIQGHQQQLLQNGWDGIDEKARTKRGASGRKRDVRTFCVYISPVQVFNRAVYRVWERRVRGLWEAFHID